MKVVAINASPHMDHGNTAMILGPFLEGMRDAGTDVEVLYTRRLNIKPCTGEFHCWVKEPGRCYIDDDMNDVYPKMREAEIWVLAAPVYVDGLPAPLKMLIDRLLPLVEPFIEIRDEHCRHPRREDAKAGKIALVSVCGFWELDNFDPMVTHVKAMCKNIGREFAGALLRPHGGALKVMRKLGVPMGDVLEAAREAGRQLVTDGVMSPETLSTISRELVPRDVYVRAVNMNFHRARLTSKLKI